MAVRPDVEMHPNDPANGPLTTAEAALVSVIIAAHNAEGFIENTCRSVLAQTYRTLEVIVVDDGSTDRTPEIVCALAAADSRVRLIRQEQLGVAAARNRAIAAASGAFIAPIDADDLWAPTKLERQIERLQHGGPEMGMVYCWWAWIDVTGSVMDRSPRWQTEGHVLEKLVEVNFTGNASVPLYRRSCLEEIGGYQSNLRYQGCEDWDLALRVAERSTVGIVPAVLVAYRRRNDGMSADGEAMWRSQKEVMTGLADRWPAISRDALERSSGQFALHLAGVAFWSGRYLQACRWVLRARPLTLVLAVLPYVVRVIGRRVFGLDQPRPPLFARNGQFDDCVGPEPLIPYARIYARHWRGGERE